MGIFSDNFYSWLDRQHNAEKTMMDEGYTHPDGKPCRAKSKESCPFYHKDMAEAEAMEVGSETPSYDRKIKELKALCESGGLKSIPGLEQASFGDLKKAYDEFLGELENYEAGDQPVNWHDTQKRRDEIYQKNKDKEYATINSQTGEVRDDCKGFGVTFHTTLSDKKLSSDEYDRKVSELVALGHTDMWNVGIFQNGGEISIDCPNGKTAIAMMLHWNQNSIYNYKSGLTIYNLTYDEKENPNLTRGAQRVA